MYGDQKTGSVALAPRASAELAARSRNSALSSATPAHHRILLVDDTAAIHGDFRKILADDDAVALDRAEAELFGASKSATPRGSFELDSAYQGQEGLKLLQQ